MLSVATFYQLLKESFRDLLPIVLVILFFQLAIIQSVPANWLSTSIGLASKFAHKGSTTWIMILDL